MTGDDSHLTKEFSDRRQEGREFANRLDRDIGDNQPNRNEFFNQIYQNAAGDGAMIPWADLAPKPELTDWLAKNPGNGQTAVDVGCGLGDNTKALFDAGYEVTGFDLSKEAIQWAKKRFENSAIDFQAADLFDLPTGWKENFDLVFECYTLQALPPEKLNSVANAIARLVKPGGTLLVYSRITDDTDKVSGPPWPLHENQYTIFEGLGFRSNTIQKFTIKRPDKTIPHIFMHLEKPLSAGTRSE